MKTTFPTEVPPDQILPDSLVEELMADDIPAEYDFDYSKAKPNRFTRRENMPNMVKLDADTTTAMPKTA